ncbi:DUF2807 domain-containing protein [Asaia spathodeae]|uniref:GIN domain-containing protein n=1 Tax=Asaia spathodeae TaxID=657016 RepID=UPI002FC33259
MIRLSLSLTLVIGALPTLALASPDTPKEALDAAPFTLTLEAPCASAITVEGAAGEQGAALLPEGDKAPEGLSFISDAHSATLRGQECTGPAHLRVPVGTAIIARMSRFGTLRISRVDGPLSVTHRGSSEVTADQVTALAFDGGGFGSLKLGWLHGPASITLNGSGDIMIGRVDSPSVAVRSGGFGNITLSAGRIAALDAHLHGSGNFNFNGVAQKATLETTGFGTITVDTVTGVVQKEAHGAASVTVRHEKAPPKSPPATHPLLTLPDGTVVTDRDLVKPDGTIIAFDKAEAADDEATETGETSQAPHHHHSAGWLFLLGVVLCVAQRKRIVPLMRRIMGSRVVSSDRQPAFATEQPAIADLTERLKRLERRVGDVEHCVTSRDFHLHREFHTLSRRCG